MIRAGHLHHCQSATRQVRDLQIHSFSQYPYYLAPSFCLVTVLVLSTIDNVSE